MLKPFGHGARVSSEPRANVGPKRKAAIRFKYGGYPHLHTGPYPGASFVSNAKVSLGEQVNKAMPFRSQIVIVLSLSIIATIALIFASRKQLRPKEMERPEALNQESSPLPDSARNRARSYRDVLAKLEAERAVFASRYKSATSAEKADILAQARGLVTSSIYTEIFPPWYGTLWDFSGITEEPQQGKIACGYFVTTVLRDAGWRVQRARMAQQASENIILSLITDPYVRRFRRVAIGDFVAAVREWGPGIYVVGLDIHIGFIVNNDEGVYFIHSSYVEPYTVVREQAIESKILAASNYRVLGRVTADDLFIEKWLLRKEIITRTT